MSSTDGTKRRRNDDYPTPEWCVHAILPWVRWDLVRTVLEPCMGGGNITGLLPEHVERWACESDPKYLTPPVDYLTYTPFGVPDLIITNPPYKHAEDFLRKSLRESATVIYLLSLNFFGSVNRRQFWRIYPPTYLFPLTPRPRFIGTSADSSEYAWFVWDRTGHVRYPGHWCKVLEGPTRKRVS